jgi:hypothetical protein
MSQAPARTFDQAILPTWQAELKATNHPNFKQQLSQREGELLPRFAEQIHRYAPAFTWWHRTWVSCAIKAIRKASQVAPPATKKNTATPYPLSNKPNGTKQPASEPTFFTASLGFGEKHDQTRQFDACSGFYFIRKRAATRRWTLMEMQRDSRRRISGRVRQILLYWLHLWSYRWTPNHFPYFGAWKEISMSPWHGISNDQAVRIVVKWLNKHPEDLHQTARVTVLVALRNAFPCNDNE